MERSDEIHEEFKRRFENSHIGVQHIATWLHWQKIRCKVPESKVGDTREESKAYSDKFDILVQERMEVKHRQLDFTDANNFKYSTMLVCACNHYNKTNPKPLMHIMLNKDMTYIGIIHRDTFNQWKIWYGRPDPKTEPEDCYTIDKTLVHYLELYP